MHTTPLLADIEPTAPRDPFARGALLPMSVETRNSTYALTELALMVDMPAMVLVECTRGTFAGESWRVPRDEVILTRNALYAGEASGPGLRTTAPVKVNGYPVETWPVLDFAPSKAPQRKGPHAWDCDSCANDGSECSACGADGSPCTESCACTDEGFPCCWCGK